MSSTTAAFQWRSDADTLRRESVIKFTEFTQRAKSQLQELLTEGSSSSTKSVHVMIGNEAADADSIVSSLVYAYYRDHASQQQQQDTPAVVYLPVLPIPRGELALRCDVMALFQSLEIDTASLVFVDEFPWRHKAFYASSPSSRLQLTLLDHNALNTKRMATDSEPLAADDLGEIVEILDHHMDVGAHSYVPHREVAFADGQALVASCCTLVAEKLFHPTAHRDTHVHALSATLLLAVIALDSINFDPAAKKVTSRDIQAADTLEPLSFASRSALFHWLQAEKFNVAHWRAFSITNCLQCDYKEFPVPSGGDSLAAQEKEQYGVSAVLIPLHDFIGKATSAVDCIGTLQSYCDANHLTFLVVMTMSFSSTDGSRQRQILFYESGEGQPFTSKCLRYFQQHGSLELEQLPTTALPFDITSDKRVVAFTQKNTGASRKQVVPLIQQALVTGTAQL